MRAIPISLGDTFGAWTVVSMAPPRGKNRVVVCRCACGDTRTVYVSHLRRGASAGCRRCMWQRSPNMRRTHGDSGSFEYRVWAGMLWRVGRHPNYLDVQMAALWRGSDGYKRFLAHVGRAPSPEHEIDRIDPRGNYEPGNVRWATSQDQNRNRRNNRLLTIGGRTQCLAAWAEEYGLNPIVVAKRLRKDWPVEEALGLAAHPRRSRWRPRTGSSAPNS